VPFNRRYYAGGSQSVRGWSGRTLSAGGEAQGPFGGNAIVETSAEFRWQLFPGAKNIYSFEPALVWLVGFIDAGNLWGEPSKIRVDEAAIAMGIGFRYNMFFGPIRIDYGVRAYDPGATERQWFYQRAFRAEVLAKGHIFFGIGHAF
jgi:outer membrane protein assembly factor BamA